MSWKYMQFADDRNHEMNVIIQFITFWDFWCKLFPNHNWWFKSTNYRIAIQPLKFGKKNRRLKLTYFFQNWTDDLAPQIKVWNISSNNNFFCLNNLLQKQSSFIEIFFSNFKRCQTSKGRVRLTNWSLYVGLNIVVEIDK